MENEIKTTELLSELRDHLGIYFQLDSSFQRVSLQIRSNTEIGKKLVQEERTFGNFSVELFTNDKDREFGYDEFDHIDFLNNLHKYCVKPSYWSTDGRKHDIGAAVLLLRDKDFVRRLKTAVEEELEKVQARILRKMGFGLKGLDEVSLDNAAEGKLEYHSKKIENLEKELLDYVPDSEKYKRVVKDIEGQRLLLDALLAFNPVKK